MSEEIIKLCENIIQNGGLYETTRDCSDIKCEECPFSFINNGIICTDDSNENYIMIANNILKRERIIC